MLEHFHPAVTRWFGAKCPARRAPQLAAIDRLVIAVVGGELPERIQIADVSPLKALWNKTLRRAQIG
jgi:hypothetical protein